jgi:hypothetical protein
MRYPNIEEAVLSMAACNGVLDRGTTNAIVLARGMEALQADNVCTEDLTKLEIWISTLTAEQKETLVDGEVGEQEDLVRTSPLGVSGEFYVGRLMNDVWEARCDS